MIQTMNDVIRELRNGRLIEAIKIFRSIYGVGLKEAKDAVEAIREACGLTNAAYREPAEFAIVSRYQGGYDPEWIVTRDYSKEDAMRHAASICDDREETLVVQVVAKSVTTRAMKEVA